RQPQLRSPKDSRYGWMRNGGHVKSHGIKDKLSTGSEFDRKRSERAMHFRNVLIAGLAPAGGGDPPGAAMFVEYPKPWKAFILGIYREWLDVGEIA
ncbi:hypothetical protein, partial [Aureimonas sp. SK2]|uniref:hypothetical protein n=1 Tax=Aureimonas sp. SK2 TaxID=3015992 RepID=UPI002443FF4F